MAYYENKLEYNKKYNKTKYTQISLLVPPATKESIQIAAKNAGKSMTRYIMDAVTERMESEETE